MEPWSYVSEGKGLLSDESVSAHDAIERGQNGSLSWELKPPCSFESNMVFSSQYAIENQEFAELGFPEMMKKYMSNGSIRDVLGSKDGGGRMFFPVTASQYSFSGENESSSNLSSLVVEPTCKDSELIDLKLGKFSDQSDAQNFNSSKTTNPILSSAESFIPTKRVRVGGLSSSTPFCQVQVCKKDLSSSKDYHKRHKVCDVHSKTTKVIVNGIEQRFCQQCSRFHLLVEFDDGKRSCRKRLACHNERRRKTHVSIHSGRNGRLFQSYNGLRFQGTAVTTPSFICQDILPSSLLHPQKYDTNDWCRHIKIEDGADYSSQSAISIANGQLLHPKPLFPFDFEKHFPPLHDSGVNTTTGGKFNGNGNGCLHDMESSNLFFQNTSIGSENFTGFDSASTAQALSEISDSDRALSLLSSQSQNSSSHSSRIPMAHYSLAQVSEFFLGMSPSASMSGMSNKIHSAGINYVEVSPVDPIIISDGNDDVNFGINGMYAKNGFSCEGEPTMDLLRLSTQLQQVEHQRQSLQVKQEHDSFCGFRIT